MNAFNQKKNDLIKKHNRTLKTENKLNTDVAIERAMLKYMLNNNLENLKAANDKSVDSENIDKKLSSSNIF